MSLRTKFQGYVTLESSQSFLKIRKLFSSGQKAKGSSFWGPMAFPAHPSYINILEELYMWRARIRIIAQTPLQKCKHYQKDSTVSFWVRERLIYMKLCSSLFPSPPSIYLCDFRKILKQEISCLPSDKFIDKNCHWPLCL